MDLKEVVNFLKSKGVSKINISLEFQDNTGIYINDEMIKNAQDAQDAPEIKKIEIPEEMTAGEF